MKDAFKVFLVLCFWAVVFVITPQFASDISCAEFRASKKSDKYHFPTCKWAQKIEARNLVIFFSPEEALNSGYKPCSFCSPPSVKSINTEARQSLINTPPPYIRFLGAARMVGGSCYLIDTGVSKFLVDCGLFYGKAHGSLNHTLDFDPSALDFILLTHAHIDHSGRIPLLYKHHFNGKTYGTDATKSIMDVMLKMSMNIPKTKGNAIFGQIDYSKTMENFEVVSYNEQRQITDDVSVIFRDAGHILGSSIIEIIIKTKDNDEQIKIVVAADIGSSNSPLHNDPAVISDADYILTESTYGAAKREQTSYRDFGKDISDTLKSGGSVLIPAFVLGKTQKILYVIGQLKGEGLIPATVPVYADSKSGQVITNIYRKYSTSTYYDNESLELFKTYGVLSFPELHEVSGAESINAHDSSRPAIFLTSSGMIDYGNAPKHLEKMIENPKNLLAVVGWQSPDSLGGKLLNLHKSGNKKIAIPIRTHINGKEEVLYVEKEVKMKIKKYEGFSSHADGCEILKWLANFNKVRKVFVVHGNKQNAAALSHAVERELGFPSHAPFLNEIVRLHPDDHQNFKIPADDQKDRSRVCDTIETLKENVINGISDQ